MTRTPIRPLSTPPRTARPSSIVAVLSVVAVLLGACATPTPTPGTTPQPASPAVAQATLPPAASASPGISPLPTEPPATGWKRLDIAVPEPPARLVATRAGAASVHPATAFQLTSTGGEPVAELALRLRVEPSLDLRTASLEGSTALLRTGAPLRQGTVYRFELERPDGSVEAAWAVQAGWPLHVDSMLPGDGAQDVPTTTGIEIVFDQPGVSTAEIADHVTITPATRGNWMVRGQTHVFIPRSPLKRSTLYTVTVRAGVRQTGTGMKLEQRETARFETSGTKAPNVHVSFGRALYDADPAERPVLGLRMWSKDEGGETTGVRRLAVEVHRLADLEDALAAWRLVHEAPDWTWTGTTPVRTASLPLVLEARMPVVRETSSEEAWFRLPRRLRAGWYVVTCTHAGVSRQAVLQVSPVATYALTTTTRTVAWVNNIATDEPIAGARVAIDGRQVGTTDRVGLVVARTPAAMLRTAEREANGDEQAGTPVAVVRASAGTMFVPLADASWCWSCSGSRASSWTLLTLDREQYRPTDTINAWGVVRDRADGSIPDRVRLTLEVPDDLAGVGVIPPVATATVTPDETGSFLARLAFSDLPPGGYRVRATAGGQTLADRWVSVGPIVKPSWKLDLTVDRHAVLEGELATVTAAAAFYEGTPVAGATLRFGTGSSDDGPSAAVTSVTGADGATRMPLTFRMSEDSQYGPTSAYVRGEEPEEAEIAAELPVMVFRSSALLGADLELLGRRLVATGAVHAVDLSRYEQPGIDFWAVDPTGAPMAGRTVTLALVEVSPVRRKVGTRYDFIAKRVITIWDVSERRRQLGRFDVVTERDGTFRLSIPVTPGEHSYELVATHADDAGRRISAGAAADDDHDWYGRTGHVVAAGTTGDEGYAEYGAGERVRVRFIDGISRPETERHLFIVLARGLRSATVQQGSRFSTRLTASLVPDAHIGAVRFNGTGYEVDVPGFTAAFRASDRRLTVQLAADRARYEPGGTVTIAVRTLDAGGRPVAASVFLRAVDEKLFTIGAAQQDTPLESLYEGTSPGIIAGAASHRGPGSAWGDGKGSGGDTTGGGGDGRSDFRDWLLASLVRTGADGRGSVSFDLSDDLTSWRVLASAVSAGLEAGAGSVSVPVGLPLFVEVVLAPEYLTVDRPVLRLRAYGTSLSAGDPVTFTVSSATLPLETTTVPGRAFAAASLALPALSEGTHSIRVAVEAGPGAERRSDAVVRTFRVVDTRTTRLHTASGTVAPATTVGGADGTTVVTLADGGKGRVVPLLDSLAADDPFRGDTAIAAAVARDVLVSQFGLPDDLSLGEIDLLRFQDGYGVSVIPYASAGLELSAMAAFSGDEHLSRSRLAAYLDGYENEAEGQLPLSARLYLLLGRASLGQASIGDVMLAATDESLTPPQVATVGLAALAVGDEELARTLYTRLLGRWGERQGPWVRVKVGDRAVDAGATAITTARAAILAAALGDPLAVALDAEVATRPPSMTTVSLEQAIAARYWAQRQPAVKATVAVTVDGERREVTMADGMPVRLELTPAQRATFRIDPVSGSVLWAARWDGPLAADDLGAPEGLSVTRKVTPAGTIPAVSTVIVSFDVTVPDIKGADCWRLVEVVPSGLAPVDSAGRWEEAEDEGEGGGPGTEGPSRVTGQRVEFCVQLDPRQRVHHLRYLARVVTPGDYRWEEASIQSMVVHDAGLVLPAFDVTIADTGS